jgi:hypothetical protein
VVEAAGPVRSEIPVNIYELGLVYDVNVQPAGRVRVSMTLTAQLSVAGSLPRKWKLVKRPGVTDAGVELVWDPRGTEADVGCREAATGIRPGFRHVFGDEIAMKLSSQKNTTPLPSATLRATGRERSDDTEISRAEGISTRRQADAVAPPRRLVHPAPAARWAATLARPADTILVSEALPRSRRAPVRLRFLQPPHRR